MPRKSSVIVEKSRKSERIRTIRNDTLDRKCRVKSVYALYDEEKIEFKRQKLQKLIKTGRAGWLNDEIIYDTLRSMLPHITIVDPVVFQPGYNLDLHEVPTSRLDISAGAVFIPVFVRNHYFLSVFTVETMEMVMFDTLRQPVLEAVERRLQLIVRKLLKTYAPNEAHRDVSVKAAQDEKLTRQTDSYNCGVLTCLIARDIAVGRKDLLNYSSHRIRWWRNTFFGYLMETDVPGAPRPKREKKKKAIESSSSPPTQSNEVIDIE